MHAKALFLDAANTLLHKPRLYPTMHAVLLERGMDIPVQTLAARHRLVSEVIMFPDKTSREFYADFNSHLLRSLGVVPDPDLLDALFSACSYLPWQPFADSTTLADIRIPMGILSNWDTSLAEKLAGIGNVHFEWILGSAAQGVRKPDPKFFAKVIEATGMAAADIVYVGDSLKLDIEPALRAGMRAVLIDRDHLYQHGNVARISSLDQLGAHL